MNGQRQHITAESFKYSPSLQVGCIIFVNPLDSNRVVKVSPPHRHSPPSEYCQIDGNSLLALKNIAPGTPRRSHATHIARIRLIRQVHRKGTLRLAILYTTLTNIPVRAGSEKVRVTSATHA